MFYKWVRVKAEKEGELFVDYLPGYYDWDDIRKDLEEEGYSEIEIKEVEI